jgi:hypothetical protein
MQTALAMGLGLNKEEGGNKLKETGSVKEYFRLLMHLGMLGCADNTVPTVEDAKPAYFAAANNLGLNITRFEKISGAWELDNILYKMDIAVEGIKGNEICKHIELIRFHKIKNGWEIELPIFSLCGIRKNDINFEPINLSKNVIN